MAAWTCYLCFQRSKSLTYCTECGEKKPLER